MKTSRKSRQRGVAVLYTALMLVVIIPMMGLTFDASIMFVIKARLQGAVDGASLSGARALARGSDGPSQITSAETTATAYVNLNYPSSYFFSTNLAVDPPTVDLSTAFQRKVTVSASVTAPNLFMRFLGAGATTVRASGTAVRRDVNIMMVVDRSGSLTASGSCGPLKQAAIGFVNKFANGRDNVGLITFASSSWADFPLANNFMTASPNVPTIIGNINCAGSTSSAQALWQAYSQLVTLNQTGALNVILFFTDGQPTGVVVDMPITTGSPCVQHPTIRGLYSTFTNSPQFFGLLNASVGPQPIVNGDLVPAPNSNGCAYDQGWANNGGVNNMTTTTDFSYVPNTDIWGNSLDTGFQGPLVYNSGHISAQAGANGYPISLNAADSAATRIRNGANDPANSRGLNSVTIFSIGLGNAAIPASPVFLQRVSNDPSSPIFDSSKPQGLYIDAPTADDLNNAFSAIASEILRLAK
jgi:Flp pilus assembly protein TadG